MVAFRWFGGQVVRSAQSGKARGLYEAGQYVLEEANRVAPEEEAILKASGVVDPPNVQAVEDAVTVSYDTPYAVRQHEETEYRHAPGREAKWLERTLERRRSTVREIIVNAMKAALRG
jgi:hypothetical protein